MFKIKSPHINDIAKLEEFFKDNPQISYLTKNKLFCLAQGFIPHNMRFLPSIHIATHEKSILGFVILRCASKPNNCWQIEEVFVIDEMRNKGVGEELVRYVLSVYGGYGVEHFLAEVDSQNFPALSLFHECGFRRYAKVSFYQKEIDVGAIHELPSLDKDFILKTQTNNDLNEIEKLDLSSIPPDLRPALGRSKEYFKQKKNSLVLIDKSRNLIIGWAQIEKQINEIQCVELLISPGWTHLYQQFLNTIICDYIPSDTNRFILTVKAIDYLTELTEMLTKLSFLTIEVKELLVRTVWLKAKERKLKSATIGVPRAAPT